MARTKLPGRLDDIAEAAVRVFSRVGYRNAQMADIASEAKVSPGTLYLYVEGKEACFWLALRKAGGECLSNEEGPLPSKTLADILKELDGRLELEAHTPKLVAAARRPEPVPSIEVELREVLEERFDGTLRDRRLVQMLEVAARNWPELFSLFYHQMRRSLIATLADYMRARMASGHLRRLDDPETASRVIIETMAWFAMHRFGDPDSPTLTDESCRQTTVDMLFHALIKPPS